MEDICTAYNNNNTKLYLLHMPRFLLCGERDVVFNRTGGWKFHMVFETLCALNVKSNNIKQ